MQNNTQHIAEAIAKKQAFQKIALFAGILSCIVLAVNI